MSGFILAGLIGIRPVFCQRGPLALICRPAGSAAPTMMRPYYYNLRLRRCHVMDGLMISCFTNQPFSDLGVELLRNG